MLPMRLPDLFPISSALPTPSLTAHDALVTESWHIPRLQMHMMSLSTGLPGPGMCPVSVQFNSTIDFDMVVPYFPTKEAGHMMPVNCKASWLNGTLPDKSVGCGTGVVVGEKEVQFGMKLHEELGARRPEMSFLLSVSRRSAMTSHNVVLQGEVSITANDATESSSYLTCLLGAPLDGLRCEIGSYMSEEEIY